MSTAPTESLSAPQIVALTQSMLSTARVDGLHPNEEALIRRFYNEQWLAGMPSYEQAVAAPAAALAPLAADKAFSEQLILMCLMAGYADGKLSAAERAHVATLAQPLGVSGARIDELLMQVKDSLLGSLAHLPDSESVAALAKTL